MTRTNHATRRTVGRTARRAALVLTLVGALVPLTACDSTTDRTDRNLREVPRLRHAPLGPVGSGLPASLVGAP